MCENLGPAQVFKWAKMLASNRENASMLRVPGRVNAHHPDEYSDDDKAPSNRSKHPPAAAAVPHNAHGKRPAPSEVGDPQPKGGSQAWAVGPVSTLSFEPASRDADPDSWTTYTTKVCTNQCCPFFFFLPPLLR